MTRVLLRGLGTVGREIARAALDADGIELVAVVDGASGHMGRDVGEIVASASSAVVVVDDLAGELSRTAPDVVVVATGATLGDVLGDLHLALDAGASVVTTCAELTSPLGVVGADELEAKALGRGRAVLAVGAGPGFAMDLLPAVLSVACSSVETITVDGILASPGDRAEPPADGAVGLREAARLLAQALGAAEGKGRSASAPRLADDDGDHGAGHEVHIDGGPGSPSLCMTSATARGASGTRYSIRIEGEPSMSIEMEIGEPFSATTAAMVIGGVRQVAGGASGLLTILDLPPVCPRTELRR